MALPTKADKPYTSWDDFKYGTLFPLGIVMWIGGLGFAVIALFL